MPKRSSLLWRKWSKISFYYSTVVHGQHQVQRHHIRSRCALLPWQTLYSWKIGRCAAQNRPKSGFQTNSEGAKILFDYVAEYADFKGDENGDMTSTPAWAALRFYIAHKVAEGNGHWRNTKPLPMPTKTVDLMGLRMQVLCRRCQRHTQWWLHWKAWKTRCHGDHRSPGRACRKS